MPGALPARGGQMVLGVGGCGNGVDSNMCRAPGGASAVVKVAPRDDQLPDTALAQQ